MTVGILLSFGLSSITSPFKPFGCSLDICKTINNLVTIATGEPSGVDASDLANNNLLIPMGGKVLPNQDKNNFIEIVILKF